MTRQPDEAVGNERCGSSEGREWTVRYQIEQCREQAESVFPPPPGGERSTAIRHGDQHTVIQPEALPELAETLRLLGQSAKHNAAARVGDNIKKIFTVGEKIEQHTRIFFRRTAHGEVLEAEDAVL